MRFPVFAGYQETGKIVIFPKRYLDFEEKNGFRAAHFFSGLPVTQVKKKRVGTYEEITFFFWSKTSLSSLTGASRRELIAGMQSTCRRPETRHHKPVSHNEMLP